MFPRRYHGEITRRKWRFSWTHINEEELRYLESCAILDPRKEMKKGKIKYDCRGEQLSRFVRWLKKRHKMDGIGELLTLRRPYGPNGTNKTDNVKYISHQNLKSLMRIVSITISNTVIACGRSPYASTLRMFSRI